MIYLTITAILVIIVLDQAASIFLCIYFDKERQRWEEERQILLNRIENPKYQPPLSNSEKQANVEEIRRLREEAEAFGLVGQIVE